MNSAIPISKTLARLGLGVLTAAGMTLAAQLAQAAQVCPGPAVTGVTSSITNGSSCALVSTSTTVDALFIGASAADEDTLTLPGATITFLSGTNPTLPAGVIFDNTISKSGDAYTLGVPVGNLAFSSNNISTGQSYVTATAYTNTDTGAFHPVYHFAYFPFADEAAYNAVFGTLVPMSAAANTFILGDGGYSAFTFVGVEDLAAVSTDDWNDLIYAFKNVTPQVPEPASLALLGTALVGFGMARRRRGNAS